MKKKKETQIIEENCARSECSLMTNVWSDWKQRSIMNIFARVKQGTPS